jgi:uncharacterized Zn finger protein
MNKQHNNEEPTHQCPVCGSEDTRKDPDFPETMRNCNWCGSEWNDMEITFDATTDI